VDKPQHQPRHYNDQATPDFLDADMTRDDLVAILAQLHFSKARRFRTIELDRGTRDYLVALLRGK
jgi:hypothetical protein